MPRLLGVHRLHYRMGGAEAVHLDHLDLFRDKGWACAEFAMSHPRNEPSDWSAYFPSYFDPTLNLTSLGSLPRFFHSGEARRNFTRLLDDFKPDVIHIHGIYNHLTNSILKPAVDRDIPIVFTLHDYKLICPAYHFFSRKTGVCEKCRGGRQWNCLVDRCNGLLAKDFLYSLDGLIQWYSGQPRAAVQRFVGPCRFTAEKFIEHGFDSRKVRFIPNFFETTDDASVADSETATLRARFGRHALYFGRLSVEKGIDILIRAAAKAEVPLVVVGDGPERTALEDEARSIGHHVDFTGHLKGSDLWAHVEAATVVVLPSIWYEIAPKSILEAHVRGKPTILSSIGGLPELVDDGINGFLVRPNDVESLADALRRVFALDETALHAMGETARMRALTTYTRDRYYGEMVDLYRELVPALQTP